MTTKFVLNKTNATSLLAVLTEAEDHVRERAAWEGYRAKCMRYIGERLLEKAHAHYAAAAIANAEQIRNWRDQIELMLTLSITASTVPQFELEE